jgi:hypothetical protein
MNSNMCKIWWRNALFIVFSGLDFTHHRCNMYLNPRVHDSIPTRKAETPLEMGGEDHEMTVLGLPKMGPGLLQVAQLVVGMN